MLVTFAPAIFSPRFKLLPFLKVYEDLVLFPYSHGLKLNKPESVISLCDYLSHTILTSSVYILVTEEEMERDSRSKKTLQFAKILLRRLKVFLA